MGHQFHHKVMPSGSFKGLTPTGKAMNDAGKLGTTDPVTVHYNSRPPNYDKIVAAFPGAATPGVIFSYGDDIYVSGDTPLTKELRAHEAVHMMQQREYPGGKDAWWDRYIADLVFRFMQELNAHQVEYETAIVGKDRPERRHHLTEIAKRLSGPLYGRMINLAEAKRLVLGKSVTFMKEPAP